MSRWSATERAAVEPLVALSAVLVLGIALPAYAVGVERSLPTGAERDLAEPTLRVVTDQVTRNGLVRPERLDVDAAAPDGYRVRVEIRAGDRVWSEGPSAPPQAETATRQVSVRLRPGRVEPGRLRVEVWT